MLRWHTKEEAHGPPAPRAKRGDEWIGMRDRLPGTAVGRGESELLALASGIGLVYLAQGREAWQCQMRFGRSGPGGAEKLAEQQVVS